MGDVWKEEETGGDKTSDKQGQKHKNTNEHNQGETNRRKY